MAAANLGLVISREGGGQITEKIYLELVATFFEELKLSEYVVTFARKSLSVLSTGEDDEKRAVNLWTKLFCHQIELLRFDEAYLALISNPNEDRLEAF